MGEERQNSSFLSKSVYYAKSKLFEKKKVTEKSTKKLSGEIPISQIHHTYKSKSKSGSYIDFI